MRKLYIPFLLVILKMPFSMSLEPCSTMEHIKYLDKVDPDYSLKRSEIEKFTRHAIEDMNTTARSNTTVYTIPVVVHILYSNGSQNLPDDVIHSQIDVLNEDFRRLNADATQTRQIFQSVAGDSKIEFCLAKRDPNGQPTNGITRTYTAENPFNANNNSMKFSTSGGIDGWPSTDYLNIWVCAIKGNVLGFAYFPGINANIDGVVVHWQAFGRMGSHLINGYSDGRTTVHEVGHYLNLYHTFEDECGHISTTCTNWGDKVCDTPPVAEATFGCPSTPNTCIEATSDMPDQFENYMDYTWDDCKNMFTLGQIERMRSLFKSGGARYSLTNSVACIPLLPCDSGIVLPLADNFDAGISSSSWALENPDLQMQWDSSSIITGADGLPTIAAFMDNYNYNSPGEEDYLMTVQLDLRLNSTAYLTFDMSYARYNSSFWDGLRIEVAEDCNNYTNVIYDKSNYNLATAADQVAFWAPGSASDWRMEVLDLSAYAGDVITVRFVNVNGYGNSLYIDNISITGDALPCLPPESVSVSNITSNKATLNWQPVINASFYTVQGRALNTNSWVNLNTTATSYIASNLGGRAYEWQVRSTCSAEEGLSPYSKLDTFGVGCHEPFELFTTNISNKSAVLNWEAVPGAYTYTIKGRVEGTSGWISLQTLGTSFNATGLSQGTSYEWMVRANCSGKISVYSYLNKFATSGGPSSVIYKPLLLEMEGWQASIHPNPVRNEAYLHIDGIDEELFSVYVLSAIGQLVLHDEYKVDPNGVIQLDLHDLSPGIYFCRVALSTEYKMIQFLKE